MNLADYIAEPARRAELARQLSTSRDYLWQIATGWNGRRVTAERCIAIETATDGVVTRYELRPDVFGEPPAAADPKPSREVA